MSKHMTIINLACTITKLRKWGEAWKHSAESAQAATARMHQAHEAKMVEHRAAFGARTEADAKIIAGLRSEIGAARMAVLERDSLMSERDGLLTQVQDMRVEIERLRIEAAKCKAERDDLYQREGIEAKKRMDVEDERDALRAEVAALQERLRSSIARGDFAQMEVAALKSQNTKQHLVKVGEWVKSPLGTRGKVVSLGVDYLEVELTNGPPTRWWPVYMCKPCDPPAADHDTEAGKAAAGAALKTEPVAEEIKVWDVVEVYQATGKHTAPNDVGFIGTVGTIHLADSVAHVRSGLGMPHIVDLCDVRKVRKVTT